MLYKRIAMALLASSLLVGCGPSTEEYARFARAGVNYTVALDALLGTAADIGIDATSELLLSKERFLKFSGAPVSSTSNPPTVFPLTAGRTGLVASAVAGVAAQPPQTVSLLSPDEIQAALPAIPAPSDQLCRSVVEQSSTVSVPGSSSFTGANPVRTRLTQSYFDYTRCDTERLVIIGQLRRQTRLLGRYFAKLEELATSDAPDSAAQAAATIGKELGGIVENMQGSAVKTKLLKPDTLSGLFGGIATGILRTEIRGALGRELQARRETLQKALVLQNAILAALASQTQADVEFIRETREQRKLVEPFIAPVPVADSDAWLAERRTLLKMNSTVVQLASAQATAAEMEGAFQELVDGRLTLSRATALLGEIDLFLDTINIVKQNLKGASR
jgi:hypothetical protein